MLPWFVRSRVSHAVRGFTQLEMMATLLVLGVLVAIASPSLLGWLRQREVDVALAQVETALQETQREAMKRGIPCNLRIESTSKGIKLGTQPVLTGNCLLGDRTLQHVALHHSRPDPSWMITFNARGENRSPNNDPGTLWITATDTQVQPKCLVISVGIGLHRVGRYENAKCITS